MTSKERTADEIRHRYGLDQNDALFQHCFDMAWRYSGRMTMVDQSELTLEIFNDLWKLTHPCSLRS